MFKNHCLYIIVMPLAEIEVATESSSINDSGIEGNKSGSSRCIESRNTSSRNSCIRNIIAVVLS